MSTRKQALWKSRNRAFRMLARRHSEEFREIRDQELEKLGEPPIVEEQPEEEEQEVR